MSIYDQFITFDEELAQRGVPALGPWFRAGLRRWFDAYEQSRTLELWACVGRGAAKSTCLYKLAMFFALFGDFEIPIGEVHFAIVLSRLKEEAGKGIAIIDRWLGLLGIKHRLAGDVIELVDQPRGIRVVAATVAAASGWRAFFVACDEFSKWSMSDSVDERDASEIRSSAIAMTATHECAPIITVSSAWGAFGEFYDAIMGEPDAARVVFGPTATWIASDGRITEEMCRRKERDHRKFRREYACEFQGGVSVALDLEELRACVRLPAELEQPSEVQIIMDPSGGSMNATAWAAFAWARSEGKPVLLVGAMGAIANAKDKGETTDTIADKIVATARAVGASVVHSDQHAAWSWRAAFESRGLTFVEHAWTSPTKNDAAMRVRELLRTRSFIIQPGDEAEALLREAAVFQERILPTGTITFGAARGNDDRVMLLFLAARIDIEGALGGSPLSTSIDYEAAASVMHLL